LINDCPGLSKEGKKWWPFIRAQLHALPVTTMSDLTAVQRLVETYAEVRICMAVLEDEEWFYESETKNGIIKRANPALGQLNEADRRLRACLIEFGMTPASRTRVKNPTGGDDGYQDPLKEFI
jgi:P27 family predicted phage terminase small subunit